MADVVSQEMKEAAPQIAKASSEVLVADEESPEDIAAAGICVFVYLFYSKCCICSWFMQNIYIFD